jgi:hypothetical protein
VGKCCWTPRAWPYSASSPPPLDADTLPMTIAPNLSSPRSQSAVPTVALNGRWISKDPARAVLAWKQVGPPDIRGWHLRTLISGLGWWWWWKLLGGSGSGYPSPLEPLCPKPRPRRSTVNFLPIVMCLGLVRIPPTSLQTAVGPSSCSDPRARLAWQTIERVLFCSTECLLRAGSHVGNLFGLASFLILRIDAS